MKDLNLSDYLFRPVVLAMAFCCPCASWSITKLQFNGSDYYQISSAEDLYEFASIVNGTHATISQNLGANAFLTNYIEVNSSVLVNDTLNTSAKSGFKAWTPIGDASNSYSGSFNGCGHIISGIYCEKSEGSDVGLFGSVSANARIDSLGIVDSYFKAFNNVGSICGSSSGSVTNCYSAAYVSGSKNVGGICGFNSQGSISNSINNGNVFGSVEEIGGICGYNYGTVNMCYNAGLVSGSAEKVGGVCGVSSLSLNNCYNTASISGSSFVGGVCGLTAGVLSNSYNVGPVDGGSYVYGVCGFNASISIDNCYYLDEGMTDKYATAKTFKQFESGEVAYLLQGEQSQAVWGQKIAVNDADDFPVLNGDVVFQYTNCVNSKLYTSEEELSGVNVGHKWGKWSDVVPATCTSKSYRIRYCVYDSAHYEVDSVDAALGHSFGAWDTLVVANCAHKGLRLRYCVRDSVEELDTIAINPDAHNFDELTAAPNADGLYAYRCANDSAHVSAYNVIKDYDGSDNLKLISPEKGIYEVDIFTIYDEKPFSSPVDFSVGELVYTREATKDTLTFILPFDVPVSAVNGKIYKLTNFDGSNLHFARVRDTAFANMPYLVIVANKGADLVANLQNVTIKATSPIDVNAGKSTHFGVFNNTTYTCGEDADYYAYVNNRFCRVLNLQVNEFRTAIRLNNATNAGGFKKPNYNPSTLGLVLDDDDTVAGVENAIAESGLVGNVSVYDVLGRAVRLNVDAEGCLEGLARGVYVVNGKKYIVRNR